MSTTDRDELRKLAEAATPGPWEADGGEISQHWSRPEPWREIIGTRVACGSYCYGGTAQGVERTEDAEFIAAANPAAVLGLLDQLDAAEAKLAAVRELHRRRPHGAGDFVFYAQTEFPDVCAHCRQVWPCTTILAIDGEVIA